MEFLLEALFQFVGELVLQVLFEAVAELGFHSLKETFRRPGNPVLSAIGFFLWGLMAGGISLLFLPRSFITNQSLRILNLAVTPLAAGGIMMLIGKLRERRGQDLVGLDRFGYAVAFAFAMALVRYTFARGAL
jgi:hypothetical protein